MATLATTQGKERSASWRLRKGITEKGLCSPANSSAASVWHLLKPSLPRNVEPKCWSFSLIISPLLCLVEYVFNLLFGNFIFGPKQQNII